MAAAAVIKGLADLSPLERRVMAHKIFAPSTLPRLPGCPASPTGRGAGRGAPVWVSTPPTQRNYWVKYFRDLMKQQIPDSLGLCYCQHSDLHVGLRIMRNGRWGTIAAIEKLERHLRVTLWPLNKGDNCSPTVHDIPANNSIHKIAFDNQSVQLPEE